MIDTGNINFITLIDSSGRSFISHTFNNSIRIIKDKIVFFSSDQKPPHKGENSSLDFKITRLAASKTKYNYKVTFKLPRIDLSEDDISIAININFLSFLRIKYAKKELWLNKKWFWLQVVLPLIIAFASVVNISIYIYNTNHYKGDNENRLIPKNKENQTNLYKDANITFEFLESIDSTWGYKILIEGSPIIIQPNKPGLTGNAGFKSQEQAEKVAKLVISKIKKGFMPPTVTIEDLKELGVI
jgi:hypothetical protein